MDGPTVEAPGQIVGRRAMFEAPPQLHPLGDIEHRCDHPVDPVVDVGERAHAHRYDSRRFGTTLDHELEIVDVDAVQYGIAGRSQLGSV